MLAKAHNPTILHPAFLSTQGIVPKDWELAEPPVCTPAISVVKYANRIVFTADLNKLTVFNNAPTQAPPLIPDLASKYVETLPHVPYSAVGINIAGYIECPSPEAWLIDRFLRCGPGNDDKLKPNALGIKLVYSVERGRLNLSIDVGTLQKTPEQVERPCLLINGNYHFTVSQDKASEETRTLLALYPKCLAHFDEIVQVVLETQPC